MFVTRHQNKAESKRLMLVVVCAGLWECWSEVKVMLTNMSVYWKRSVNWALLVRWFILVRVAVLFLCIFL